MYSEIKWLLWLHIHISLHIILHCINYFFERIVKNSWKWCFYLNECLLTYRCSKKAFLTYTLCIISLDLTFDQLVTQCQTTVFKYYESRREVPLYDPAVMRDFCEKSAPELFDLLLKSITNERWQQSIAW